MTEAGSRALGGRAKIALGVLAVAAVGVLAATVVRSGSGTVEATIPRPVHGW